MEYGTVPMIQASFRGFFYFVFAMLKKKRENTANVDKILGEIVVKIIKLETGKKWTWIFSAFHNAEIDIELQKFKFCITIMKL